MRINRRDLNITNSFDLEKLKKALCDMRPCRPKRFKHALEKIDFDKIVKGLERPVISETVSVRGVVYWRKVDFENKSRSCKFVILFPMLRADSEVVYPIRIYYRGNAYHGSKEDVQEVINKIAEQFAIVNEA